jgi:hypothetical protein
LYDAGEPYGGHVGHRDLPLEEHRLVRIALPLLRYDSEELVPGLLRCDEYGPFRRARVKRMAFEQALSRSLRGQAREARRS